MTKQDERMATIELEQTLAYAKSKMVYGARWEDVLKSFVLVFEAFIKYEKSKESK